MSGYMINRNAVIRAIAVSVLAIVVSKPVLSNETPVVRDAPAPKSVLFIGNSFIYYNNSLHAHVRKLTQSVFPVKAKGYLFKAMTISGSYLGDHAPGADHMLKTYTHKKKKGPWDLVILQGQSRAPINRKKAAAFQKSARLLDRKIRDAGARTAFFMTWAYKNKPKMAKPLSDAYTRIGNDLKALVVPVGLAFDLARTNDPGMELYIKDKKHPSRLGTYLAASVFFATLYGKSPVGAPYTAGLSRQEAKFAQTTAWTAVQTYFGK